MSPDDDNLYHANTHDKNCTTAMTISHAMRNDNAQQQKNKYTTAMTKGQSGYVMRNNNAQQETHTAMTYSQNR